MTASNMDNVALSMLAMAETLRIQQPPKFKMAIKCARGALKLQTSVQMTAHVNFQLGKLLFFYTDNQMEAREHLTIAYNSMLQFGGNHFLNDRLEALALICESYLYGDDFTSHFAKLTTLIRSEINNVSPTQPIYYKLLLYYIEGCCNADDPQHALEACQLGLQQSLNSNDTKMNLYFRVTKSLISCRCLNKRLEEKERQEIKLLLNYTEQQQPNSPFIFNLRFFKSCVKLAFVMSDGKTRTSRKSLRKVQNAVQNSAMLNSQQPGIRWMDSIQMTIFACLMTIVNSTLQCNYDRAQKYYVYGKKCADDYIAKAVRQPSEAGILKSVQRMKLAILEMMAHCNIMACRPCDAITNIGEMVRFSDEIPREVGNEFRCAIQSLLGIYCIYLRDMDLAEKHFLAALKQKPIGNNAQVMAYVNLALLYLSQCKHGEYYEIAEKLTSNKVSQCSTLVQNNFKFLQTFHAYLVNKMEECNISITHLLDEAKGEDLFRLHAIGFLILIIIKRISLNGLQTIIDWSKKANDHVLLNWCYSTIARSQRANNEDSSEFEAEMKNEANLFDPHAMRVQHDSSNAGQLINVSQKEALAQISHK
ncbi:hypothetical protein WR25_18912 [Diploscapter pachys]|uniref:Cohesin loading complex subunit SCC4 homolog n=1 Tax=Diploscapter pachys TaxID=2018661 RepID=A0A2A2KHC8_9BILA|nr:hypothetical protein WR25_18912 [Diploscapter pachys]